MAPGVKSTGGSVKCDVKLKRDGTLHPLRLHEILYESDELVFSQESAGVCSADVLVDAQRHVTLNAQSPKLPKFAWSGLESILPKLVSVAQFQ